MAICKSSGSSTTQIQFSYCLCQNIFKMKNINKLPFYIMSIFGTITVFVIYAFLSGKVIPIPQGTSQGGIIGAIGVSVIMIVMAIVMFGVLLLFNRRS